MKEYQELILTIAAIFALLLIGVFFSPTFEEKKSFLLLTMNVAILVIAFALLLLIATIGFRSFALYGAVFMALVVAMLGVEALLLVILITYAIWGFIFGFEVLLVGHRVESAEQWFQERYTFESFYQEYRIFYPMIIIVYTIVEILPTLLGLEKPKRFEANEIVGRMREILR